MTREYIEEELSKILNTTKFDKVVMGMSIGDIELEFTFNNRKHIVGYIECIDCEADDVYDWYGINPKRHKEMVEFIIKMSDYSAEETHVGYYTVNKE